MKETIYTIRWYATGDVEQHLTINDVYREAFNNNGALQDGFVVRSVNGVRQIIAIVTKEDT